MNVLLLIGSPRTRSTSQSLGDYLLEQLEERNCSTETLIIHRALRSEEGSAELLAATRRTDILVLTFPLYVDSLPYPVIRALEIIAQHRQENPPQKRQLFLPIVNCGFPEAHHNDTALAICRQFALQAGFQWAGALSLGGGGTISGRPLTAMGGMVKNVIRSLDLVAGAFAENKTVPPEAEELMAKPLIPPWIYTGLGNIGWKRQAKKYGSQNNLNARPFLDQDKVISD